MGMSNIKFKGRDGEYTAENCPDTLLEWYAKNANSAVRMQRELAIKTLEMRKATGTSVAAPAQTERKSSPPPAQSRAIVPARTEIKPFVSSEAEYLNSQMMVLANATHLISPATVFSRLPVGYSAQVTIVQISQADDCVPVEGALMLSAATLKRVNTAIGLSWVMEHTKFLLIADNHWIFQAVGEYLDVDGCKRQVSGVYEFDVRDGSARVEAIWAKAQAQAREETNKEFNSTQGQPGTEEEENALWNSIYDRILEQKNTAAQKDLDGQRKNGLTRAETGAKSRATSELIKRSEKKGPEAWKKPIACVRLIRTQDAQASTQAMYPEESTPNGNVHDVEPEPTKE
jgi:hypothetical protein